MQKYGIVSDLAILIKSKGRHNIKDFTTMAFIEQYFRRNKDVAIYTPHAEVESHKTLLLEECISSWTVVGCDDGIYAADKDMLTGAWPFETSRRETDIFLYVNDDVSKVNCLKFTDGKKTATRCSPEMLHTTTMDMVRCMQAFNIHLAGFASAPNPMNVRHGANFTTNICTIMDPLTLHRRGTMLLYPEATQYKSDWAKSVQSYIHGGPNLRASFIMPMFASYSERGGLGPQNASWIKKEKASEAAIAKSIPSIFLL